MYNTRSRRYTHGKIYKKSHNADFFNILKNKPLDRITVKDICEQCEINRNTFYYYFGTYMMCLRLYLRTGKACYG